MILTFPHMGNIYIGAKILLSSLGLNYVIPPVNNGKSLEIGSKISPEEMCLPFKIMMGNYIQSIERGADTILLVSSCGPCRFGEYSELQMRLLRKSGYDAKFILADLPGELKQDDKILPLSRFIREIDVSTKQLTKSVLLTLKAVNTIDYIEKKAHFNAGYVINNGESKRMLKSALIESYNASSPDKALKILTEYKNKLNRVELDKTKSPLKIAIIGEIYTIIDSFSNQYIEDKLMDFGVISYRRLTPTWWIKDLVLKAVKLNGLNVKYFSRKYLPYSVGGHGKECIAEAVMSCRNFDGAIQIFPSGCMPEIVAKSILPSISKHSNFPIMSLIMDEMTGQIGYDTRIEAFLDLLERRRFLCTI